MISIICAVLLGIVAIPVISKLKSCELFESEIYVPIIITVVALLTLTIILKLLSKNK